MPKLLPQWFFVFVLYLWHLLLRRFFFFLLIVRLFAREICVFHLNDFPNPREHDQNHLQFHGAFHHDILQACHQFRRGAIINNLLNFFAKFFSYLFDYILYNLIN
jgi:hypothetical protein